MLYSLSFPQLLAKDVSDVEDRGGSGREARATALFKFYFIFIFSAAQLRNSIAGLYLPESPAGMASFWELSGSDLGTVPRQTTSSSSHCDWVSLHIK